MIKILVNGCGKMAHAIEAVSSDQDVQLTFHKKDDDFSNLKQSDVCIDFSSPTALDVLLNSALQYRKPLVIGTTGYNLGQKQKIEEASKQIPIVYSSNFAIGTNIFFYIIEQIASLAKENFHPEIVEIHHSQKKDSPSGTALTLAKILENAYKIPLGYGRHGLTENPTNEIGIHSIRWGEVVGTHTAYFFGQGESLELTHRSSDRKIFAIGALKAAQWILGKQSNLYSMKEVLGI